ncbi:MAG: hypothetical protein ACR2OW_08300 [Methyloligellaceae bacterium]
MSRQHIADQLISLEAIIRSSACGLTIHDIETHCEFALHRRTLQRRLETLVRENRVHRIIRPHCTRYFPSAAGSGREKPLTRAPVKALEFKH